MKIKHITLHPTLACALCLLAACGGGSGSSALMFAGQAVSDVDVASLQPAADAGFATADTAVTRGTVWTLDEVSQLSYVSDSTTRAIENRDVTIDITETSGLVTVTIDGATYDLVFDEGRDSTFRSDGFEHSAVMRREYYPDPNVEFVYLAHTQYGPGRFGIADGSAGFYTIGFKTDPQTVDQLSGSATYVGEMDVIISGDGQVGFGEGDIELVADFGSSRISGQATIENGFVANVPIPNDLFVPTTTFNLEVSTISDGAFIGDLSISDGGALPFGADFAGGSYEGAVYGPLADGLGGQVTGSWVFGDGTTAYTMQGAFVGIRDGDE
ncbi:transferrin-binding protein-like solute binding protein [Loktanella sp. F6476L]|uniref:transferrin-binding protein-like solute binding protein n=1 Tax=Loktanella sp. F6476L TaxID=2926405 RepID=UPI001FF38DE7|nr:transferrin-binding protein-like solute binding protein [Loktanella sp. F6476L]MCK0121073.1 transferrin-binding protein-like solute binding protein [Loktanella sp. F6476L]